VHGANFFYCYCVRQRLKPLRIRTHNPLTWGERYEPFIRQAEFLPLARLVTRGMPLMDAAAFTVLMDQWHLETHTFHLPSGEITVTLQDVIMILGLPIDSTLVCGMVSPVGWRDSVGHAIGLRPPDVAPDQNDMKTMGVHSGWLTAHFNTYPKGAEDAVIQRYVWSCVSYMHEE
jgi:hypothetical protein